MREAEESDERQNLLAELRKRHSSQEENIQKVTKSEKFDDDGFHRLDSTLKKTTAFMKKVRNIGTSATASSLMPELEKLNLSMFMDELAASIAEAKFKSGEIGSVVDVCVFLASRYKVFPENLIAQLRKSLPSKKADKIANPSKLRVDIRFLAELLLNGVFCNHKEGLQLFGQSLNFIMTTDKSEHANVGILLPLCRSLAIIDCSDIVPAKFDSDVPRSSILTSDQRKAVGQLFRDYLRSLIEHANTVRVEMNKIHRHIKRLERTRGDASNEDRAKFEEFKSQFMRLYQNGQELSESLGLEMPTMAEEPSDDEEDEQAAVRLSADINQGRILLWPDDDTRRFYENLLDLCRVAVNINVQPEDTYVSTSQEGTVQQLCDKIEDIDLTEFEHERDDAKSEKNEENAEDKNEENAEDEQSEEEGDSSEDESQPVVSANVTTTTCDVVGENTVSGEENRRRMDEFLDRLSNSINREMIDRSSQEFAFELYKNKRNRKRLSAYMVEGAPKDRLDLLPFFARFLATLNQVYPEYVHDICKELIGLFRDYVRLIKRIRLDAKVYAVRFVGELIKFGVISKAEALNCLRMLMSELKQSNVDLICCLIESVGQFLYRSPESYPKMKVLLDVMKRKKEKIKDPRQQILLDNAYYSVIPPEETSEFVDNRLPVEKEYILKRLNEKVNRVSALRKIDWSDDDIGVFALEAISDPTSVPFGNINQLARCVSSLSEKYDWLYNEVLDNILERIRLSLEIGVLAISQHVMANVVYLGHLYNEEVCELHVIMLVLYQLISFNVREEDPRNLLRTRLVCSLLRVVGEFFRKGSRRRKVDVFLCYFYRFYWSKKDVWLQRGSDWGQFPLDIDFMMKEMLNELGREDFPTSLEEANKMVEKIEKAYMMQEGPQLASDGTRLLHDIIEEGDEGDYDEESEQEFDEVEDEDYEDEDYEEYDEEGDFDDEEEYAEDESEQDEHDMERDDEDADYPSDVDDEEEHVTVHTQRRILPEDEQFMNDLDRMLSEAYMTAPVAKAPAADLTIPQAAIQKLERRITFPADVASPYPSAVDLAYRGAAAAEPTKPEKMKMALLTRGKGNKTVLKAVSLETPKNLEESWRMRQAQREQEHNEMKRLTLKMNERIMNDDDTDPK
ncbi:hypothetical protein L596_004724 [Steinernema carpocapsae]|uniref:MIF4G domain-containing protein n=1 Tax=Steinernema carpocapsae TaxID=34508 RepID=A0A4U8UXR9_STECR|nr:hypothetical protein L596_004724 [Steinernema carpocapsae]